MYDILLVILGEVCSEVKLMLNEKRVKHMVKLASYESKYGTEDIKVSTYFKNDYISLNLIFTFIWTTISYVLMVAILGLAYMDLLLDNLTLMRIVYIGGAVVGIYIVVLIASLVFAGWFYKKRHLRARKHIKVYRGNLEKLESIYEQEAR